MILVIKITEKEFDDFSPDFLNSLDTNISNSLIKKIIIFVNFPYFNLNKLKTIVIQNNGTDVDLIKQVCKIYPNKTIIWANKLAKFDNTLSKLNKVDLIENLVYVNSKFNGKENINSLDALIFNSNSKIEYSDNIIDSIMSKKISLDINVINKKPDINTEKVMLKVLKQSPVKISIENNETIITKKEIYKLSVIIVSVNYNDYLLVSLSNNIKYFEDITVVTSSDDLVCQKICDIFGVKCVITDRIYEDGASFNKGKAINDGIKSIDNPDWILLLDADIVLTKKIDINDDVDVLYTSDRYICKDYNTYKDWQGGKIEIDKVGKYETNRGLGFFHLFNINSSDINKELPFPESSNDAAWSDLHFRDKFTKKSKIDKSVIHLGPTYKNWKGRKTDAFLSDDLFHDLFNNQLNKNILEVLNDIPFFGEKVKMNINFDIKDDQQFIYHITSLYKSYDIETNRRSEFAQKNWKKLYENKKIIPCLNYSKINDTEMPIIKDLFDYGYDMSQNDSDIIMYTNSDICLTNDLYEKIVESCNKWKCTFSFRKDFPFKLEREMKNEEVELAKWSDCGDYPKGADLFAVTKSWWREWRNYIPNNQVIGRPTWDWVFRITMGKSIEGDIVFRQQFNKQGLICETPNISYHENHESYWQKEENIFSEENLKNIRIAYNWMSEKSPNVKFTGKDWMKRTFGEKILLNK